MIYWWGRVTISHPRGEERDRRASIHCHVTRHVSLFWLSTRATSDGDVLVSNRRIFSPPPRNSSLRFRFRRLWLPPPWLHRRRSPFRRRRVAGSSSRFALFLPHLSLSASQPKKSFSLEKLFEFRPLTEEPNWVLFDALTIFSGWRVHSVELESPS